MIKALIFDLGNVVTSNNWHYDCPEKDKEFCAYFGVSMDDFERGWNSAWPLIQTGKITEDEFWNIFLTESNVKNIDISHAKKLWRKYQVVHFDVLNVIIKLRNYYPLYGCTNNGKEWVDYFKKTYHFDSYFDEIINSADVGVGKPNKKIYEIVIQKTGFTPPEIVFIDDTPTLIQAAQQIGLQTITFENVKQLETELKQLGVHTDVLDISSRNHSFYWQTDRKITELQIKRIFLSRHSYFDEASAQAAIEYGMKKKVVSLIPPIKSGSINSVVKATLEDGMEVIMRMHPNGLKNGYFWVEKAVADAARNAGVPTYKTYFIDDSKERFPFDYMILSCEAGKNMHHAGPYNAKTDKILIEDTGRLMALTHSVKTNKYGFFDNDRAKNTNELVGIHSNWRDHIFASFSDNLTYLVANNSISHNEREQIEKVFENNNHLINCDSPRLVHNDIADWNQLTDLKKITAFIDWDESFSGDPICDFSTYSVFYDDLRLTHLKNGYAEVTTLPEDFESKFHLYRLRYIISKLTLRTKRSVFDTSDFLLHNLMFAQTLMKKELDWYKKNNK